MNSLLPFGQDQLLKRNSHRITLLFLGTAILVLPFYVYLAIQSGAWQLFTLAGAVLMLVVVSAVSVRLARRDQANRSIRLLVGAILVLLLIAATLISGLGVAAGLIAVIVTLAIVTQTLPPQNLNKTLLASVIAAIAAGFLDLWAPPFQFVVPGIRSLTLFVALLLLLLFAIVIARQFSAYHLSTKLIIIFLAFTLVPIGLLAVLNNQLSRTVLTQDANQKLLTAATETAADVDTFIQSNLNQVRSEAQLPQFADYLALPAGERSGNAAETQVLAVLQALQSKDEANIHSYALLDREGRVLLTTAPPATVWPVGDHHLPVTGVTNQPTVSPVYAPGAAGAGDQPALYFSSPIPAAAPAASPTLSSSASPDAGDAAGVLLLRYNATVLQQLISQSNGLAGDASFAVLFDENLIHLAHGLRPETIFTLVAPAAGTGTVAQLQAEGRLPDRPAAELVVTIPTLAQNLGAAEGTPNFAAEGSTLAPGLNQAAAVELTNQPWRLAFFQPRAVFLIPAARWTQITIVLAVVIAGVVAVGAIGVSQRLTAPIVHLTEVADQVTRGDLTAQARVSASDESGALALTFNTMTAQLRDLIDTLEQRVADRTRALATSTEVSRRLSTILDQEQLVAQVVEQVRTAFDYYHVHIYLFDDDNETLVMVGGTGEAGRAMLAAGHKLAAGQGLVGRAGATNATIFVADVATEPAWLPNPLLPQTRAEAAVPIAVGQRVLGVLDVQHNRLNALQQQDLDLLQGIANQVAVALRNAQLFSQVQAQSQELLLINRVVSAVAASLDLQQSLQIIATELAHALNVEQIGIALLDPDGHSLTVVAEHLGQTGVTSALGFVIPVEGNSLTEQVLATREPVIAPDAQHNPLTAPVHDIMRQRQVQTLVILPMIAGDAVIGTVGIDSLQAEYVFSAGQLRLAETIIFQAAAAVQNARLFEQTQAALAETQQRSRELALINEVVAAVAASLDLQAGLNTVCRRLAEAVDVQQVRIALLNEDSTQLTIVAEHYDSAHSVSALGFVIPVEGNPLTQQVLAIRQPVVVTDAQRNPLTAPVHDGLRQQGVESLVVLPILAGNEVIGTVGIDLLEKERALSSDELRLTQTIVFQVATAVQNARLFEQTEDKARHLAVINQVSQAVSQQLELDHLLNAIYEQLGHVMRVDAFLVALYDARTETVTYPFVYDNGRRYQHPPAPLSPTFKLHRVIVEGQPIRRNRTSAEVAQRQAESTAVRVGDEQKVSASLLYVPMQLGVRPIGALSVQSYAYNAYDEADVTILGGIASHVAVALENAQLFEQTQIALTETDLLYQASARLNAAQSYNDVLAALREHTQMGQQAYLAHLAHFDQPWLSDERPSWLEIKANWSALAPDAATSPASEEPLPRYRLADLPSIPLLQANEPTLIEDVATDSRLDQATRNLFGQPPGVQSAVFVPLLLGRQWIGYAGLFYQQPRTFPEREVRHLVALAGQAAVTLQTIHLLEETNRLLFSEQRQRLITDTLLRAAGRMAESLSESELRRITVEQIHDILLPAHVNLFEWLPGDNCLRLDVRLLGPAGQAQDAYQLGYVITPADRPDLWQVFSENSPLLEAQAGPELQPRQHYCLPWFVGARPMGVIEVYAAPVPDGHSVTISDEDQVRCQGVVRQAAIALQNARSYEQEQARARREQVLREIAAKVRGSADVDTIMRTAVQEIGETLGRRTILYLGKDNNGETEV